MATRDNEMQHLKVRGVEELGHARILSNAGKLGRSLVRPQPLSKIGAITTHIHAALAGVKRLAEPV
jgi:hypothetical protein